MVLYSSPPDDAASPRYYPIGDPEFLEPAIRIADLSSDKADVIEAVRGMAYQGGGTATGAALDVARSMLERTVRAGASKAVLLVTDGEATDWARMEIAAGDVRRSGALLLIAVISEPGKSMHETAAVAATYSHVVTPPARIPGS